MAANNLFAQGNIIKLDHAHFGKCLRISDVDGNEASDVECEGEGVRARGQWIVHNKGNNVIQLENRENGRFLRINPHNNDKWEAAGAGGKWCDLVVIKDGNHYNFRAEEHKNSDRYCLGVLDDGTMKPASETGTGRHGEWDVKDVK